MNRLAGKRTIITGAAGGQGQVACRLFAAEGAKVLATDMDPAAGTRIEAIAPGAISYVAADLTDPEGIKAVVDRARSYLGSVDVLYNNHGIIQNKPFLETTRAEYNAVLEVDLHSFYFLTQAIVPLMNRNGSIVNISSGLGLIAIPNASAYCIAKAGIINLTRCLAVELEPRGIRANVICPGVIDTPMPRRMAGEGPDKEQILASFLQTQLMKRLGRPEEIVYMAMYLASDEATFTTGAVFSVDGGTSAW
jgi:NAD(P)-dependent dehydrogenase (short-subunit alcohol dehydrogenase family)